MEGNQIEPQQTNKQAIKLIEENQYDQAFKWFQKAVNVSRDIQSLTNLAWIYANEESDDETARQLLNEAVEMNPTSHFPYSLLGEIYLRLENWETAKQNLQTAISIQPTKPTHNNLAVAHYHLAELEAASDHFLLGSEDSDWAMYSHVKCLIALGKTKEAKQKLDTFSKNDEEFVGEVDVADLYVELDCHNEAVDWFKKGWDLYTKDPEWISRYVYSLIKLNHHIQAQEIIQESIQAQNQEIQEAYEEECDEGWTEKKKQEYIKDLQDKKQKYEQMIQRLSTGPKPKLIFEPSILKACYLFGCTRHNHPEYGIKEQQA